MHNLSLESSFLICGKPKSGKTHFIKYLLYLFTSKKDLYSRVNYGIVFNKTSFTNSYNFIPKSWVYAKYNPDVLRNLMNLQKSIIKAGKVPCYSFVLFDDCLGSKQFKSDLFKDLVQNYRHYRIIPIISSQYVNRIETVNRECCSHAVIFRQFSKNAIEATYNSFGQRFQSEKQYKEFLNKKTADYNFMLDDTENLSENLNESYLVMKAPPKIPKPYIPYVKNIPLNKLKDLKIEDE